MAKRDYNEIEPKQPEQIEEQEEKKEESREKKEKVIQGEVKVKKRGLVERFVIAFLGPDGLPTVTRHVNKEIIMPAVKNVFLKSVNTGLEMLVNGGKPMDNEPYNPSHKQRINYSRSYREANGYYRTTPEPMHTAPKEHTRPSRNKKYRSNYVEEYIIESKEEALAVLDNMMESILSYGSVSVAEYYDMIGVDTVYTDHSWGWTGDDLRRATIRYANSGVIINLPPVREI